MVKGDKNPEKAAEEKEAARRKAKSRVEHLEQTTAAAIPVFPYAYRKGDRVPHWVKTPPGVNREAFIAENFSYDYLPATANEEQYENLYGQLHMHAYPIAAHILLSSREFIITPEKIENGNTFPEVKYVGTPVTSFIDKQMKETYHFIRVHDDETGIYIDFLRENASGYVFAWRAFLTLAEAVTAYLCYFRDEPEIKEKLASLFNFMKTNQRSRYSVIKLLKIGTDTMRNGIVRFGRVHGKPNMVEDSGTVLSVHFFLFAFGEVPRSDIAKRRMYRTIFSETEDETEEIGDAYQALATSWNYSSKTTCVLNLFVLEMKMAAEMKALRPNKHNPKQPHSSIVNFLEEMMIHRRMAQDMCRWISGQVFRNEFALSKQPINGKYMYGENAYKRLVNECISLLKYSELVLAVMVREKPYWKALYIEEFSAVESEKPINDEAAFFELFDSFADARKLDAEHRSLILMEFLPHALPFLERWEYTVHVVDAINIEEIRCRCNEFKTRVLEGMSKDAAARWVMHDWSRRRRLAKTRKLRKAVNSLISFIPKNNHADGSGGMKA